MGFRTGYGTELFFTGRLSTHLNFATLLTTALWLPVAWLEEIGGSGMRQVALSRQVAVSRTKEPKERNFNGSINGAFLDSQIDLKHISQKNDKDNKVEIGIDLREYYPSVEWDILGVPAERHEKYYPCCAEPYPGEFSRV